MSGLLLDNVNETVNRDDLSLGRKSVFNCGSSNHTAIETGTKHMIRRNGESMFYNYDQQE